MLDMGYRFALVLAVVSYFQVTSDASESVSRQRRDIPMMRMGRSLGMIRMGRSFGEERAAGPRMGREEEEEADKDTPNDDYRRLLYQHLIEDLQRNSNQELYPSENDDSSEEEKDQEDRAIPYPRVGRAMGLIRMGKRSEDKRALGLIRMGKKAMGMIRMGRAMNMIRMGRSGEQSEDKRSMGMIRMGKKDTDKRALGMIRMGKRQSEATDKAAA